jgi:hypothetical protein
LIGRGESFVFETVFSDPVGDKVAFLEEAAGRGYVVNPATNQGNDPR